MNFRLGTRSKHKLIGVERPLADVVRLAIRLTKVDFTVLEGIRDKERQAMLVRIGASTTMNSRHLTGHAVDLGAWVNSQVAWDWPLYYKISGAMFEAAHELMINIEWGGHWSSFKDGPHYQLPWAEYPNVIGV